MSNAVQMTFQVEPELRADFTDAALLEDRPAAQVLREFMRDYVVQMRDRRQRAANGGISAEERQRREEAARFAIDCVGLEGLEVSEEAQKQMRRHVNGEIELTELLQAKAEAQATRIR